MNFHKSINDLYKGEFNLSPRALEKLKYTIGFEYSKRFNDLAKFWAKENNKEEVKYYEECVRRLRS